MVFQPFADTDRTTKPPFAASPDPDDSPMTDLDAAALVLASTVPTKAAVWQLHRHSQVLSRLSDTT